MQGRRKFCKSTLLAAGACSFGGAFLLSSCSTTNIALTTDYTVFDKEIKVQLNAFVEKTHLVFDNDKLEQPVYVNKVSASEYRAFLMRCTHRGCTVRTSGPVMVCPCHGSEFNNKGEVLSGPANEALLEYKTIKSENKLIIKIS